MLGASEFSVRDQGAVVTQGPWVARDSSASETALQVERLCAKLARLEHQGEVVNHHVTTLMDNARQATRFQAFAESLRNAREFKIDELQRTVRDVRARLEQVQGPKSKQSSLTYKSFETVDEKLRELAALQGRVASIERMMRFSIAIFSTSLLVLASAVATRLY